MRRRERGRGESEEGGGRGGRSGGMGREREGQKREKEKEAKEGHKDTRARAQKHQTKIGTKIPDVHVLAKCYFAVC